MTAETPKTVYLKDYRPPPFLIEDVDLMHATRAEIDEIERVVARGPEHLRNHGSEADDDQVRESD